MMTYRSVLTAGLVVSAAAALAGSPRAARAQALANRVASAPDGQVHFTYASRDGVCGDGRTFIAEDFDTPGGFTMYTNEGMNFSTITGIGSDFRGRCDPGPVLVILTV